MRLAVFMFTSGGGVALKRSDTISRRPREAAIMSAVSPLRGWRASMTATLRVESHLDTTLRSSDATAARMRVDMATTPPRGGGCRRTTLISGAKTSKAAREATDHIRRDRALEGTRMVLAWSVWELRRAHTPFSETCTTSGYSKIINGVNSV